MPGCRAGILKSGPMGSCEMRAHFPVCTKKEAVIPLAETAALRLEKLVQAAMLFLSNCIWNGAPDCAVFSFRYQPLRATAAVICRVPALTGAGSAIVHEGVARRHAGTLEAHTSYCPAAKGG